MTLQELRYLVAVADHGSFVRAAEACHVGQPTLSTQLKKLEEILGVTLFERNKHRLIPTPMGEMIIEQARRALDIVARIREIAHLGLDPMNGPLRLGVIPTLGPYLIPCLLPKIRAAFPQLHLFLREDLTGNLLERLRKGRLDALLLALPVKGDDLQAIELFREPFTVALPAGHPLAAKRTICEAELAGQNVLLLEEGHCMRDQALAICGAASSDEREELKATSLETLRQMVAAGIGCTLLPKLAAMPGVGSVKSDMVEIRPLAAPAPFRTIGIVWRQRYPREATVRGLAKLILDNLPAAARPEEPRPPAEPEPPKLTRSVRRTPRAVAA
jgi:LysR family hydrogen peroxide-inducible transcriptional activator